MHTGADTVSYDEITIQPDEQPAEDDAVVESVDRSADFVAMNEVGIDGLDDTAATAAQYSAKVTAAAAVLPVADPLAKFSTAPNISRGGPEVPSELSNVAQKYSKDASKKSNKKLQVTLVVSILVALLTVSVVAVYTII